MPVELLGKSADELREYFASLGERPFRAAQLYHAMYAERHFDFAAITNIPTTLREKLAHEARISPRKPRQSGGNLLPWTVRSVTSFRSAMRRVKAGQNSRRSNPCSCPAMVARRFAFPRKPAALWTATFA